jgi:hypothetical protein
MSQVAGATADPRACKILQKALQTGASPEEAEQAVRMALGLQLQTGPATTPAESTAPSGPHGEPGEQAVPAEQDEEEKLAQLKLAYFTAICDASRGARDGTLRSARLAAAVCDIPTVPFDEWRKRVGL